jgi:outer membrane receptor protein involved in Fe transport
MNRRMVRAFVALRLQFTPTPDEVRGSVQLPNPQMQPENRLIRICRRACPFLCTIGAAVTQADERPVQLEAVTVAADRLPSRGEDVPFSITRIDSEGIRSAPQLRLDDLLRDAAPGFSLFRRSSSRVAHPTAQGVSLRNIGPNGAGRTLVLLDGIPLNDPFAGWVAWNRVPPASLGEIIVSPGGGAGLFGNAALAGTIYLKSPEASGNSGRLIGTIGNRDTYEGSFETHLESGPLEFSGFVNRFSTGGYPVLQGDQRGPVDTDADVESWVWRAGLGWKLDEHSQISVQVSSFEEERGNGTRLTNNASEGQDFSVTWSRQFPELEGELRMQAYVQRREFRSLFSSVNAGRTEETLVLDQYDVPSNTAGGSVVWSQQLNDVHRIVGGADFRWIEGETNEAFLRIDDAFTRSRHAGGRQLFVGGFLEENWKVTDAVKVVAGGRLDYWRQFDGSRLERDRVTGETLRASEFDQQDGWEPNARLGVSAQVTRRVRLHGAGYTGFRVPTLNELYRPFRVGNDVTEANAALEPERLFGGELGVEWVPMERFRVSLTGFYNQLHDAIGNVTIGEGPENFEPGGFVPEGGVLRQRRNLDRVEVFGMEARVLWEFAADWRLRAQYVQTDPTVARASEDSQLEGKLLAQAPEQVGVAAIEWTPGRWHATAQVRYVGRQFEDDLNTLPLAPFTTVDLSLAYQFNDHVRAAINVENLFDTESEVGKTTSGLVSIGAPRLVSLTVAVAF